MELRIKERLRRPAARVALITLGLATYVFLLWQLPWWLDKEHLASATPGSAAVVTGMRTALVAVGAGIVAGFGLYYTDRNLKHSRTVLEHTQKTSSEQAELTRTSISVSESSAVKQAELAAEQQVNDRYVKAIELLASDKVTNRLGGLYALERIMRDSPKDHDTVVKVISAFIREFAIEPELPSEHTVHGLYRPRADIQAALTILGQRPSRKEGFEIDLRHTYLRGCELLNCNFARVDFSDANLDDTNLTRVDFTQATFHDSHFSSSNWDRVKMPHAFISGTSFRDTTAYSKVDLTYAQAGFTDWSGSTFHEGASLKDAYLHEANLSNCEGIEAKEILKAEDLTNATLPESLLQDPKVAAKIGGDNSQNPA